MNQLKIFIDGSVHARSKIGYGAYLVVSDIGVSLDILKEQVKVKQFENTSSTKLELQNLLWVLQDIGILDDKITIYTDSQNIISLQNRREKLEKTNYFSRKNTRLNNYALYQAFYQVIDTVDCHFVKVLGHQKPSQKNDIDRLFTLVDRGARQALRKGVAHMTSD